MLLVEINPNINFYWFAFKNKYAYNHNLDTGGIRCNISKSLTHENYLKSNGIHMCDI